MRYLARCDGPLRELDQLRAPMAAVLDFFVHQKKELERYRTKYGDLSDSEHDDVESEPVENGDVEELDEESDDEPTNASDAGSELSDTEQE